MFSANPFGLALFHFQDSKSSGTEGDALTSGSWSTRDITTSVTNEISGASLGSNQLTLPTGTYFIDAIVYLGSSQGTGTAQCTLYNVTDGSHTLMGGNLKFGADSACPPSSVRGRFTIAAQKVFEIRARTTNTLSTITAMSVGQNEVYLDGVVYRIV